MKALVGILACIVRDINMSVADLQENEWNDVFMEKSKYLYFPLTVKGMRSPVKIGKA